MAGSGIGRTKGGQSLYITGSALAGCCMLRACAGDQEVEVKLVPVIWRVISRTGWEQVGSRQGWKVTPDGTSGGG